MADKLARFCPFSFTLVQEPFWNGSGTVQDPFGNAGDSGTALERFWNGSGTVPERIQNSPMTFQNRF